MHLYENDPEQIIINVLVAYDTVCKVRLTNWPGGML